MKLATKSAFEKIFPLRSQDIEEGDKLLDTLYPDEMLMALDDDDPDPWDDPPYAPDVNASGVSVVAEALGDRIHDATQPEDFRHFDWIDWSNVEWGTPEWETQNGNS